MVYNLGVGAYHKSKGGLGGGAQYMQDYVLPLQYAQSTLDVGNVMSYSEGQPHSCYVT